MQVSEPNTTAAGREPEAVTPNNAPNATTTFDVKKHLIKVQGGRDYLPVAWRLVWFRLEHPDWTIETEPYLLDLDGAVCVFRSTIRDAGGRIIAQGTKVENVRGFSDYIEKAETGAIGRALGMIGYGTQFCPEFDEGERLADAPHGNGGQGYQGNRGSGGRGRQGGRDGVRIGNQGQAGPAPCAECGRELNQAQTAFSTAHYGRPLCPAHQPKPGEAPPPQAPPAAPPQAPTQGAAPPEGVPDPLGLRDRHPAAPQAPAPDSAAEAGGDPFTDEGAPAPNGNGRTLDPVKPEASAGGEGCAACGQVITPVVKTYSLQRYGKPLCRECQAEAARQARA